MLLSSHWRSEMIAAQALIANLSPFVGSLKYDAGGAILLNSLFAINHQLVCRTVRKDNDSLAFVFSGWLGRSFLTLLWCLTFLRLFSNWLINCL